MAGRGANENTVVSFSTAVTVEGKPLAAGRYGLHLIPAEPGAGAWTVIFSSNSSNWGSFSYDAKEDALRVPVTPEAVLRAKSGCSTPSTRSPTTRR